MPRRKKLVPGPKRRSVRAGPLRSNTKGFLPTSTSLGGDVFRINVDRRGVVRTTAKIPGTNIRQRGYLGPGRLKKSSAASPPQHESGSKKRGCLPGCGPLVLIVAMIAVVLVVIA